MHQAKKWIDDGTKIYFVQTNRQRIADFEHLSAYVRDLYQQPGIAETVDMPYIKQHYYGSHHSPAAADTPDSTAIEVPQ